MAQTAAHLVDHAIPHVPVRQWVLSLPIPLRLLLAAQPKLVAPVLQVVHRVITRYLLGQAGLKFEEADSGAVTLIQRVFEIDMEHCPNCGGELKIIAAILEQPVIEKIFPHLGLQARAPPRAPARGQALQAA